MTKIVIVGCGIVGATIAYELISILESNKRQGYSWGKGKGERLKLYKYAFFPLPLTFNHTKYVSRYFC